MTPFIQIHTLTPYPAVLLNRDSQGFAKRMPFGGAIRTRISSQCLKRHWRVDSGPYSLSTIDGIELSVRSRAHFDEITKALIKEGHDEDTVVQVVVKMKDLLLPKSSKKKDQETKEKKMQIITLGEPERRYLHHEAREIVLRATALGQEGQEPKKKTTKGKKAAPSTPASEAFAERVTKEWKENLQGLYQGAGLASAMFGRMITSDILARKDAAVHVMHAFTTHSEETEIDYFTAVDDLVPDGSAHINTTELTSGLFYSYVVIDVPLLVSNIEGCPRSKWMNHRTPLVGEVLRRMIHLITTTSPGAKVGSTAPYSNAQFLMVEMGAAQPRTLANSFLTPVPLGPGLLERSAQALADQTERLDRMYGSQWKRKVAYLHDSSPFSGLGVDQLTVSEIAKSVAEEFGG